MNTETPQWTFKGHTNWVQIVAWSPDNQILASGSMDSTIRLWNCKTGAPLGDALKAHTASITAIAWEPFKDDMECKRFASSSRDATIRIWDAKLRRVLMTLSQHAAPIMCLRWGGENTLYSGARDKMIKMWSAKDVLFLILFFLYSKRENVSRHWKGMHIG
jgi:ribosome assembly protein 4